MMTLGHCHAPCRFTFYLFHVAVFFIASGFFYKDKNSDSSDAVLKYLIKKIKGLWLPYVLSIAFFSITHNLQLNIGILTTDTRVLELTGGEYDYEMLAEEWSIVNVFNNIFRGFFFGGGTPFAGNIWFLRVLFMISVGYCFSSFFIKKILSHISERINIICQTLLSIIFLIAGFMLQKAGITLFGISTALSCYCLYHVGTLLGRYADFIKDPIRLTILGIGSLALLTILYQKGIGIMNTSLVSNEYADPVFLIITSLAGWFALYFFSAIFNSLPGFCNLLSACGRHSLIIMIMHPICFKVVNLIQVRKYKLPLYSLATYPVIDPDNMWWFLYAVAGVAIPLFIGITWKKIYTGKSIVT